ncbi:hypothetical protein ONS96_013222 [Cadophora gregata f. sp. sojae]|nr:hypothetical protein ONS96_013222 [Cadophora gregata f. sp. sojae]
MMLRYIKRALLSITILMQSVHPLDRSPDSFSLPKISYFHKIQLFSRTYHLFTLSVQSPHQFYTIMKTTFFSLSVILLSQIGYATADHHSHCICADTKTGVGNRDRTQLSCSNTESVANKREFRNVPFDNRTPFECYSSNNSIDGDDWDAQCRSFGNTHGRCH